MNCKHCGRTIIKDGGIWVDPEATGDDEIWRETCMDHDSFMAEHEPDGGRMIRFTTTSGTVYELDLDAKLLTRFGANGPLRHVNGGRFTDEPDAMPVTFDRPPTVGESFFYTGPPPFYTCGSTPVVGIEDVDE